MTLELINPPELGRPMGYSHGVLAPPGGRILAVAGQIAWDERQRIVSDEMPAQIGQALANVVAVVRAAGGEPTDVAQLTLFVTDKAAYLTQLEAVGRAYRAVMGRHYPAMALVEVKALLEPRALVEVQALAVIPPRPTPPAP